MANKTTLLLEGREAVTSCSTCGPSVRRLAKRQKRGLTAVSGVCGSGVTLSFPTAERARDLARIVGALTDDRCTDVFVEAIADELEERLNRRRPVDGACSKCGAILEPEYV